MEDVLVPLTVFGSIAICVVFFFHYRARVRERTQQTLEKAIEHGQQLSVDVIQALGVVPAPTPFSDLRKGVLFIATGIALALFSQFVEDEPVRELIGVAMFPILLGVGFFVVYFLGKRQPS